SGLVVFAISTSARASRLHQGVNARALVGRSVEELESEFGRGTRYRSDYLVYEFSLIERSVEITLDEDERVVNAWLSDS
ncbi:MAG TPA: hypothetical protein VEI97_00275, partial [bacterium]|nr:hypothetical protein [bacterium]